MATRTGERVASVQRNVAVEYKQEPELAPIPHHNTVGTTAAAWDPLLPQGNATLTHAQVSLNTSLKYHVFRPLRHLLTVILDHSTIIVRSG